MKIKVLLIMPNKEVQVVKIPANHNFIKNFIGDKIYRVYLSENIAMILNKNASIDEFNRILNSNIILGNFLIVSIKNNHMVSLKKKEIRKYINMFKLRKHQKKVERCKVRYLEEYYSNIKNMKQRNAEKNKKDIFNIAA